MQLFQYVIFFNPKKTDSKKTDNKPIILTDVTNVLAKDQHSATLLAARAIPESYLDKLDEVTVAVKSF